MEKWVLVGCFILAAVPAEGDDVVTQSDQPLDLPAPRASAAPYRLPPPQQPTVTTPNQSLVHGAGSPAHQLLMEKLAQRDRLQREIEELYRALGTGEQIVVNLKVMEVNVTKARRLGFDVDGIAAGAPPSAAEGDVGQLLDSLSNKGLVRVLANPTIATASGRPASFFAGGEAPVSAPRSQTVTEYREIGTRLDLQAVCIGANKVRLSIRPTVSHLAEEDKAAPRAERSPAFQVLKCDLNCEATFGQTVVLTGAAEKRMRVTRGPLGRVTEDYEIAIVVTVTPQLATADGAALPAPCSK